MAHIWCSYFTITTRQGYPSVYYRISNTLHTTSLLNNPSSPTRISWTVNAIISYERKRVEFH